MDKTGILRVLGEETARSDHEGRKYLIELVSSPPCSVGCPAGVDVKSYVNLMADRRYQEALGVILRNNPFPGVCGRVCTHPCENECDLGESSGSISIRHLKRYAADHEISRRNLFVQKTKTIYDEKIAVVGSGPAGLTSALDLTGLGYDVTVFERESRPGGMIGQCIPDYRLPKKVVDFEIGEIRRTGVNIITSHGVRNTDTLLSKGYSAIIVAAGAVKDRSLNIPGGEKEGIRDSMAFLRNVNMGNNVELEGRVIVIGGGSSAFDAARTAVRCGAETVILAYRRTEEEMPANREEIEEAKEEGIEIIPLVMPVSVMGDQRVESVEFVRTELGESDESGRRMFVVRDGTVFNLAADWVIPAIGAVPDIKGFGNEMELTKWGTIQVDEKGMTSKKGVFAGGDAVTGPSTIIDAIASGHMLARSVHSWLRGFEIEEKKNAEMFAIRFDKEMIGICQVPECKLPEERIKGFDEVNMGFTEGAVKREASRCECCGSCHHCDTCLVSCDWGQVHATLEGQTFLVKAPYEIREMVMKGRSEWEMENDEGRSRILLRSLIPDVDEERCIACGRCEESCSYNAIQVRLIMGDRPAVTVDPEMCRGCGGCVASCPSGAIGLGPMSLDVLGRNVRGILKERPDDPLMISSYWVPGKSAFEKDIVETMSMRMVTPGLMIEALASGTPGVLIIAPKEDVGDHYLPSERTVDEVVELTRELISLVGLDPSRIRLWKGEWGKRGGIVDIFRSELTDKGLFSLSNVLEQCPDTHFPAVRALNLLSMMTKNPDMDIQLPLPGDETCIDHMRLLDILFRSEGLDLLGEMVSSAEKLAGTFEISSGKMVQRELLMRSSERWNDITNEVTEDLPNIALLRCPGDEEYGAEIFRELYEKITGRTVFEIMSSRTGIKWLQFDRELAEEGSDIFEKSVPHDPKILVTVSPFTTAALKLLTYPGSWRARAPPVKDVLTVLSDILNTWGCRT